MPIKIEPDGRRSVQAEVDVPGTPEEVWNAIASGPGINAWFVPTEIDGRVGGTTKSSFAPDGSMDAVARITAWQPPHRYVAEAEEEPGTVATEWTVEAKAGGTCTVRVVHSWFASGDDWDHQFEGHTFGWQSYFQILRLYLAHFAGQPSQLVQLTAMASGATKKAWDRLVRPLGLDGASVGARVAAPDDAPALAGVVEAVNPPEWPGLLLRLNEPAPAVAHFFAMPMGKSVMLPVRFYLYGGTAAGIAGTIAATWQDWLDKRFPAPSASKPEPVSSG